MGEVVKLCDRKRLVASNSLFKWVLSGSITRSISNSRFTFGLPFVLKGYCRF